VLRFKKTKEEAGNLSLYDYADGGLILIKECKDWGGDIVLFSTEFTRRVDEICSFRIDDVFTIRISPRTPEIKNSPDVVRSDSAPDGNTYLPILNSKNLKIGEVIYKPLTGYWIEKNKVTKLRKFFREPHIVVSLGFRGDKQIGAAYDHRAFPWMGDVYHLLRKNTLMNSSFDMSSQEVVSFLNSEITKRYIRDVFRDITYHFNITQIKNLPMPTKDELRKLEEELS